MSPRPSAKASTFFSSTDTFFYPLYVCFSRNMTTVKRLTCSRWSKPSWKTKNEQKRKKITSNLVWQAAAAAEKKINVFIWKMHNDMIFLFFTMSFLPCSILLSASKKFTAPLNISYDLLQSLLHTLYTQVRTFLFCSRLIEHRGIRCFGS